jgi:hypothetical protein
MAQSSRVKAHSGKVSEWMGGLTRLLRFGT